VDADRHQPRAAAGPRLVEQVVEAEPQALEEMTGRGVGRGDQVPDVVVHLAVRHHQERRAQRVRVVGKLVVVGVGVVAETAVLDQQFPGMDGGEGPDHPAPRRPAGGPRQGLGRPADLVALLVTAQADRVRAVPVVAVGEHVMIPGPQPRAERRVPLDRQRAGGERDRDLAAVDQAAQPPDPDPAAVLHVRLGADVPDLGPVLERVLAPGVVDAVLAERVLAALLVVDHEVDRDPGAAGPVEIGRLRAVADEIAGRAGHQYAIHPPSTIRVAPLM
jgi:hypothetical protein